MSTPQWRHRPSAIEWTGWAAVSALLHALALAVLFMLAAASSKPTAPHTADDQNRIAATERR